MSVEFPCGHRRVMFRVMSDLPIISTERTVLEIPGPERAALMLDYYRSNRARLHHWEPERDESFFTLEHWTELLAIQTRMYHRGAMLSFAALNKERTEVLGICNFRNITRGVFQSCTLGYSVSGDYEGRGLMYEVLQTATDYVFSELKLHRIMANYMPENQRSAALLERLGFEREGFAKSYLRIAGRWRDHVLTSKINPADL